MVRVTRDTTDGKHVCMLPNIPPCSSVPPTAGTYRVILCWVRWLRLPCARHHGTLSSIRSQARLRAERARVSCAAHPYSAAALAHETINTVLTMAILFYVPFQVFIVCPNRYDPFILFSDAMSFAHMLASFCIGYVEEDVKQIVLEPRRIARHYLKTYFLPDLVGALPLQTIYLFGNCRYPSHTILLILKLFRLPTFIKETGSLLEQLQLSYVNKRMITMTLKLVLFFHWMTYIHYQVPCLAIHYFGQDARYKVWLRRFVIVKLPYDSIFQKYTANLFLVCGLCIGAGYYNPVDEHLISELILTSSMGLVGLVFLTYAFTSLLQLAMYRQYERNLFNGRFRELKHYMTLTRLPMFLQRKIQLFINYKYNGHYFNEEVIMNTINEQIKQDINMYGCKKMVMEVPLFQDMPITLINAIIFNLTQVLYMPGEILVKYGESATSLFMISSGTVAVISTSGTELAHLKDGSYFGETALLHPGKPRVANIIALEITEIYKLDNKEFQTCLQPYPHLRRRLEENYMRRRYGSMRADNSHQPYNATSP